MLIAILGGVITVVKGVSFALALVFGARWLASSDWRQAVSSTFVPALSICKSQIVLSVLMFFVLGFSSQAHEIYLIFGEDFAQGKNPFEGSWGIVLFLPMLMWITLFRSTSLLLLNTPKEKDDLPQSHYFPRLNGALNLLLRTRLIPWYVSLLPVVGMTLGILLEAASASSSMLAWGLMKLLFNLNYISIPAPLLWVVGYRFFMTRFGLPMTTAFVANFSAQLIWLVSHLILPAGVILLLFDSVSPTRLLSPFGIICLFTAGMSTFLFALKILSHKLNFPVTATVIIIPIFFSFLTLNDNHRLDLHSPVKDSDAAFLDNPPEAFDHWIKTRWPDENNQGQVPGDTIVVSAQGGGLYAAYHTAIFLAHLRDTHPEVANRIFAISGVSGGAVGAVIYTMVADSGLCPEVPNPNKPNCHVQAVRDILRQDFLSPPLAGLFFSDLFSRFIPFENLASPFSRSRALEDGFVNTLTSVLPTGQNLINTAIHESWNANGSPLLLLNTTDVTTGRRMIFTPLRKIGSSSRTDVPTAETFWQVRQCEELKECSSPSILAASLVSARFPLITPAAKIAVGKNPKRDAHFVDGGYFENTGIETAVDLINSLKGANGQKEITLVTMDFPERPTSIINSSRDLSFGEIWSPFRALSATRRARGELAWRRASNTPGLNRHLSISLDDRNEEFTLGWILAESTFDRIECHIWNDEVCNPLSKLAKPEELPLTPSTERCEDREIRRANRVNIRALVTGIAPKPPDYETCYGSSGRW